MAPLAMADLSWTISVRVFRSVGAEVVSASRGNAQSAIIPDCKTTSFGDTKWVRHFSKRWHQLQGSPVWVCGQPLRGDYTRHSFSYVIPAGEPGAGETVSIILRNELLAHARQGKTDAPWQEWRRCTAKVS
jgi:hypothetical protein